MFCSVDDDQTEFSEGKVLPGRPLSTGFESGRADGARLSDVAAERVRQKMRSVDEARARAAQDSRTAYVG